MLHFLVHIILLIRCKNCISQVFYVTPDILELASLEDKYQFDALQTINEVGVECFTDVNPVITETVFFSHAANKLKS